MPRELSSTPNAIRKRLRRGNANAERDLEMLGYKPVAEWEIAELAHGRPRAADGTFRGKRPKWVTPQIAAEARKRLQDVAYGELMQGASLAASVIINVMRDPEASTKDRLDAAKFVYEQLMGKAAVKGEIDVKIGPREFLASALLVEDDEGNYVSAHPVVDGQFRVDDEDDEEDDLPPEGRRSRTGQRGPHHLKDA